MSSMAVSYKQRQEDQVGTNLRLHTPPSSSRFFLVHCGFSLEVEGTGSEVGTPHHVRPYLAVRHVGEGVKVLGGGLMYKDVPQ